VFSAVKLATDFDWQTILMIADEAFEIQAEHLLARIHNPKRTRKFWR
jgi:hypothetical protein